MKHFFDNVRANNKTVESLEEEKAVLRTDLRHLRSFCSGATGELAGEEATRLLGLLHSI